MFFARYDCDGDRALGEEEKKRMLADLEGKRVDLDQEIAQDNKTGASGGDAAGVVGEGGVSFEEFAQ